MKLKFEKPFFYAVLFLLLISCAQNSKTGNQSDLCALVNPYIGTDANGNTLPVASVPHGMVQVGPDTRRSSSGYKYSDSSIIGFSHLHKTGGGCGDLLDILFMPVSDSTSILPGTAENPDSGYRSRFSHDEEHPEPGKYTVKLLDYNILAEISATERAAIHRYTYPKSDFNAVIIDLEHGNDGGCSILKEESTDNVREASIRIVDNRTIEGYRISDGWSKGQHVYFTASFSEPFRVTYLFDGEKLVNSQSVMSRQSRAMIRFNNLSKPLTIKVGISSVDNVGSLNNLETEMPGWDLDKVASDSKARWNKEFQRFKIESGSKDDLAKFYTGVFHWLHYPMIFSDVDRRYRGPGEKIMLAKGYTNYSAVVGIWDTFRGANPLLVNTEPDVANDYIKTFLAHYNATGLLPVWVLQSYETLTMIGYHAMPVIVDTYYKGVRNYDVEAVYQAIVSSAMKDTFGVSMGRVMGTRNYKKYGYIPADLEYESVAQTLEFSYDDWCIAQMAKMLDKKDDYEYFLKRSESYKKVFDISTNFMRGRMSDGNWHSHFNPFNSIHRSDDYCEGNAWQWTFFVPHNIKGLADLMGGKEQLTLKLDSLFAIKTGIVGEGASGDISGMIGQYAQGNEPSHHIVYMYDELGQAWKAQKLISEVMSTLYLNSPEGYCGNEDTGQMVAWYLWNAMGMYPVTHGDGRYYIGTPLFKKIEFQHANGKLTIIADKSSPNDIYIDEIQVNGKEHHQFWFDHNVIFKGDVTISFKMSDKPNKVWFKQQPQS